MCLWKINEIESRNDVPLQTSLEIMKAARSNNGKPQNTLMFKHHLGRLKAGSELQQRLTLAFH